MRMGGGGVSAFTSSLWEGHADYSCVDVSDEAYSATVGAADGHIAGGVLPRGLLASLQRRRALRTPTLDGFRSAHACPCEIVSRDLEVRFVLTTESMLISTKT